MTDVVFDDCSALVSESIAFPHLSTLLEESSPAAGPSTRSHSRAGPEPTPAPKLLSLTPLEEITTDGMDPEMIWEQMEMRGTVVTDLLEEMFGEGEPGEDDDEGDDDEDGEDEDGMEFGSDEEEEMSGEEYDEEEDDDDEDDEPHYEELGPAGVSADSDEEEQEQETVDPMADETRDLTLDSFDRPGSAPTAKRQRRYVESLQPRAPDATPFPALPRLTDLPTLLHLVQRAWTGLSGGRPVFLPA